MRGSTTRGIAQLVGAGLILVASPLNVEAVPYTLTPIGGMQQARGINNAGAIVGNTTDGGSIRGVILSGSSLTTFDVPGTTTTIPGDITEAGLIAGTYADPSTAAGRGFVLNGTAIGSIDIPGAQVTVVARMNSLGWLAGSYTNAAGSHGFVLDAHGTLTTIDAPGALATEVLGMNDAGTVVGDYVENVSGSIRIRGFIFAAGVFTPFDAPGALATSLHDINNVDIILGDFQSADGTQPFLLAKGVITALPFLGANALGLNDHGQIVGEFAGRGFVATRVPEPRSGVLLAAGLLGLGIVGGLCGVRRAR